MSAGSPIVPIRIPPLLLSAIDASIESANKHTKGEPYNRSSWILHCVTAKLAHQERSKKSRKKKSKPAE